MDWGGSLGCVEEIWGETARQQARFAALALGAAALLWFRIADGFSDGVVKRYIRFVAAPCTLLIGLGALLTAAW